MESGDSFIYIMTNHTHKGWVKVGFTDRDVEQRRAELSSATGVLHPFKIAHVFRVPGGTGEDAERLAHAALNKFKRRKEFFQCTPEQAVCEIELALARIVSLSAIDVRKARADVESSWRAKRAVYSELSRIRDEHTQAKADLDRTLLEQTRTLERDLGHRYAAQLRENSLAYWGLSGLIILVSFGIGGPILAMLVLFPGAFIWGPALTKRFPTSADELTEYQLKVSELRKHRDEAVSKLDAALGEREIGLKQQAQSLGERQKAGEDTLRSFKLSHKFKDS